jgi:hypothetical protein
MALLFWKSSLSVAADHMLSMNQVDRPYIGSTQVDTCNNDCA